MAGDHLGVYILYIMYDALASNTKESRMQFSDLPLLRIVDHVQAAIAENSIRFSCLCRVCTAVLHSSWTDRASLVGVLARGQRRGRWNN
ncbi:MAG TPA: hypothetical protein VLK85_10125 [Ramlibacter sp.]|nr:hypothetical protein [Ramlibacter sp.]